MTMMRTNVSALRLLAIAAVAVSAGCFKLSRESPRLQLYALGGGAASASPAVNTPAANNGAAGAARTPLSIGLRRLQLASYLSVPAVMVRRGANQLVASEFHRWGGDLDEGINRAVATYLASALPVRSVDVAPWPSRVQHNFIVQLHVSRFEGTADSTAKDGRTHVVAGWDIIRPLNGALLMRGQTEDRNGTFRVGDYAALVAGLDAALSHVARDIGACLARFPNDSTPPASCGSAPAGESGSR